MKRKTVELSIIKKKLRKLQSLVEKFTERKVTQYGNSLPCGTETLFSDESPCELVCSPSLCSGDELQMEDTHSINSRLAPPNIQPYSGVLERVSA
ncbi:hypothetical protein JTB14_011171 [Gonioctena quinquepunctata]|nr:hypothetical protein JTB14_011171 [Gonioctena quinquepunctata]